MAKTFVKSRTFGVEGVIANGINAGDKFVLVAYDGFVYSTRNGFVADLLGVVIPKDGTPYPYALSLTRLKQQSEFELCDSMNIADLKEGTTIKITATKAVKIKDFEIKALAFTKCPKTSVFTDEKTIKVNDYEIYLEDFSEAIHKNVIAEEKAEEEEE
jgi:hypothetical protein